MSESPQEKKIATRLFVEEPLTQGVKIGLDHARSHFLRSVLRLGQDVRLAVFNGCDGEWLARIEGLGKGWASLEVLEQRRPQTPEPDLWLAFAPIKRGRIDFLVDDLAANKVSEEAESAVLAKLGAELQRIGDEHVGQAASLLRELAAIGGGKGGGKPDQARGAAPDRAKLAEIQAAARGLLGI